MGFIELRESRPIPSLLKLPAGLATAWNLSSGDVATLAVGSMAVRAMVTSSDRLYLEIDHSIVGASGSQCGNARWLPGIEWETTIETVEVPQPERSQTNRLITENDVRRARMQRQTIEIGKGQLITPAARSLGEELGVIRHGGNSR
ncbi:MAG: hypothetical protein R3284_00750 [Rubricoccaceae bacterium]|nr:hypothetical protein [Rubricoccaceae bacterium]